MPRIASPLRRGARLLAVAGLLACALTVAAPVAAQTEAVREAEDTERVRAAEDAVDAARDRVAAEEEAVARIAEALDAAAARYENANAHRLRLSAEAVEVQLEVVTAEQRARAAERRFAAQVSDLYKHPGVELALAEAVVLAPDPDTAVHRAALLERVTVRERVRAVRARDGATLAGDVRRQQHVVQAGARWAEQESDRLAGELEVALDEAAAGLDDARRSLADARAERDRVAAEEAERIAAERRAAEIAARGSGPLPPVDGKVCPIGAPNAFIDSWGFPRSGGRTHKGVDMFAAHGMPLYAVADGTVRRVWNNRLGGLSIDLLDDRGDRYYYAHLSAATVSSGDRVRAGEVIGANGNSGNARATPPHLHWQYHPGGGRPVNPYPLAHALCR